MSRVCVKQCPPDEPAWTGMQYEAIRIFVSQMSHLETEWNSEKLEKKLREYFNKGARQMAYKGKLEKLINEYCDNVLGSVFNALGDREWLSQVDFLLCVDAGIKDNFPAIAFKNVKQAEFEELVEAAYTRAFDEQGFWPILTEAMSTVTGPNIKKKVWTSIDEGRKHTAKLGCATADEFVQKWITVVISKLAGVSRGGPETLFSPEAMSALFLSLLAGGALPRHLAEAAREPPVHIVEATVNSAYAEHHVPEPPGGWEMAALAMGGGMGMAPTGPPSKMFKAALV